MDKDSNNINLKIENKEVAQFTGMARAQMFFETVMSFLKMLLAIVVVAGILSAIGYISWVIYQDSNQPKPVATTKPKAKVERPLEPKAEPKLEHSADPEKSESISSWRDLKRGMSESQVRSILGEPGKIDGGTFAFWRYKNGGTVTFYQDKLDSWSEPR
jgi:cytoskeletal protein RodZ